MKHRLVLVKWVDSHQTSDWERNLPEQEPHVCFTAGFLLHDGKHTKTIAGSVTADGVHSTGAMTIPTCAILSMHTLKKGKR